MNTIEELARLLEEDDEMMTLCQKHKVGSHVMCKAADILRKYIKIMETEHCPQCHTSFPESSMTQCSICGWKKTTPRNDSEDNKIEIKCKFKVYEIGMLLRALDNMAEQCDLEKESKQYLALLKKVDTHS